jgi:hypothetical protein
MLSMATDGCSRCAAILLESDGGLHWHGNWPAGLSSGDGRRGIHPLGCRHGQRGRKVASLQHSAFSIQHPASFVLRGQAISFFDKLTQN